MLELEVPEGINKVLLHACCAPCSSAIVECLLQNGVRPTLYFCNPNIFPNEEYLIRKNECIRYAEELGLDMIDADYNHEDWLNEIKGLEDEPERGKRCLNCFYYRLNKTAEYAAAHDFKFFATTLATSRWKSLDQIEKAGNLSAQNNSPTQFWHRNWRKGGLTERRKEIIEAYHFYNQTYCGCEFSMRRNK